MKPLLLTLILLCTTVATSVAKTQPAIIFSQDVIAINADGSQIPPVKIEPEKMPDMQTHDFDLGRERLLRIHTNISNARERGLDDVVSTVERCYNYIESSTGQQLNRGVMLYLIELDETPYAYSFRATYNDASQWGEVRLALIDRNAPLSGIHSPASLSDLLYDTLPHELGHDAFNDIPQLLHDIDGGVSQNTRWFIEGICEVLAKGFSEREVPSLHKYFLSLRNVGTVLAERQMRDDLLNWGQNNDNNMVLESNLYGAAMLAMMTWTETIPLLELFELLETHSEPIRGTNLVAMMQKTTGSGPEKMLSRAHTHGRRLGENMVVTQLEIE